MEGNGLGLYNLHEPLGLAIQATPQPCAVVASHILGHRDTERCGKTRHCSKKMLSSWRWSELQWTLHVLHWVRLIIQPLIKSPWH